ncbi:hypothetical protein Vadar_014205 [Vaccinium darrowii]|uniref:Uncharacterized protein n=1 Tax=Vaccinium darrowii TaxID=229202 RepID=A0ACB7XHV5_9ERIC|nr:hypothetical protein Vadar_014205 [Vaccinium darrowii]
MHGRFGGTRIKARVTQGYPCAEDPQEAIRLCTEWIPDNRADRVDERFPTASEGWWNGRVIGRIPLKTDGAIAMGPTSWKPPPLGESVVTRVGNASRRWTFATLAEPATLTLMPSPPLARPALRSGGSRTVVLGDIPAPSFEPGQEDVTCIASLGPSWMDPLVAYLRDERLPEDKKAAHRLRCQAASYFLSATGQLCRRTYIGPDLRVIHEEEVPQVLHELHAGSSGCHSGGRSLAE